MKRELDFRFEDFVDESINKIRSGEATAEECIALHPEWADELRPVLSAAVAFGVARPAAADESFKANLRSKLIDMAETRQQTVILPAPIKRGLLARLSTLWTSSRYSFAAASMAVLMLAGGTAYAASMQSLPGSPLYVLKIAGERASLNISVNHAKKTRHYLRQAEVRLSELKSLSGTGANARGWASELAEAAIKADREALRIVKADPAAADETRADFENSFTRQRALFNSVNADIPEPFRSDLAALIGASVPGEESSTQEESQSSGSVTTEIPNADAGRAAEDISGSDGGNGGNGGAYGGQAGQNEADGVSDQEEPSGTSGTADPEDAGNGGAGDSDSAGDGAGGDDTGGSGGTGGIDNTGGNSGGSGGMGGNSGGGDNGGNSGGNSGGSGSSGNGGGQGGDKGQGGGDLHASNPNPGKGPDNNNDRGHQDGGGKETKSGGGQGQSGGHPTINDSGGPKDKGVSAKSKDHGAKDKGAGVKDNTGGGKETQGKDGGPTGSAKDAKGNTKGNTSDTKGNGNAGDTKGNAGDTKGKDDGGAGKDGGGKKDPGGAGNSGKDKPDNGKSKSDTAKSNSGGGPNKYESSGGGEATWVKENPQKKAPGHKPSQKTLDESKGSAGQKATLLDKLLSPLKSITGLKQKGR